MRQRTRIEHCGVQAGPSVTWYDRRMRVVRLMSTLMEVSSRPSAAVDCFICTLVENGSCKPRSPAAHRTG